MRHLAKVVFCAAIASLAHTAAAAPPHQHTRHVVIGPASGPSAEGVQNWQRILKNSLSPGFPADAASAMQLSYSRSLQNLFVRDMRQILTPQQWTAVMSRPSCGFLLQCAGSTNIPSEP